MFKDLRLLFSFLFCASLSAQELPPVNVFTPQQYGADNQNWDISQAPNNLIYLANNAGLLEFNGAEWQLYQVPNSSIVRSVKAIETKILTGSFMDFGYWQKNNLGILEYYSLVSNLNLNLEQDEEFWNIDYVDEWAIFQSLSRIYLINIKTNEAKIINANGPIVKLINVDNDLFYQEIGKGILKIENGKSVLINNDDFFKQHKIISIFKRKNQLIYLTENMGFYQYHHGELIKWNSSLDNSQSIVYNAISLKDNSMVIGTISNGVYCLNSDGSLKYKLNREKGISNNTILSLFEDSFNNIWLGLDNGINCINNSSKFKVYLDSEGRLGTVYTSLAHEGYLYLGTNQGVFYKKIESDSDFEFINGTNGQVWMLKVIYDSIFCGHDKGTMILKNQRLETILNQEHGTWDFKLIKGSENLVLQGNYKGLCVLEWKNGTWSFRNKIKGLEMSSRFFESVENTIYVNHEFKGLYKLSIDSDYRNVLNQEQIKTPEGDYGSSVLEFNGSLIYSSLTGVLKQNKAKNFEKDSVFTSLFNNSKRLTTLMKVKEEKNKLWRYVDDNINIVTSGSVSSKPKLTTIPISKNITNMVAGFENMTKIDTEKYLIGTSNGYLLLENPSLNNKLKLNININTIEVYKIDEPKFNINTTSNNIVLRNKQNNIQFHYSFPFFDKTVENEYQYQLIGLSDKWSEWTHNASQLFENLSYGEYNFNIRGRSGNNTTNIVNYRFTIERPFYLSNTAIIIYICLFLIFFKLTDVYYKKQQKKFLKHTQEELIRKELKNKQQITQLNNEKLKIDIENKNRELAISTMSIIKKNQFLNTIKKELNQIQLGNNLKSVIKIIDKNINNTDDWKFFQEAFNNADKDFLNKVKSKHNNLTPNDLKLCAYLRLNLSSKEIAPLLNISSRSVEVKRYRLRKKMNLPHETSLTNYILEL